MPATTLRYRRVTTVGLASNAINLSSSGAMGHRVQVPMSVADLNSFFRWARYPGAPRAIGHFNAAGASAVGGPTFLNALQVSLGLSFNDMDANVSGLNFKSSILDSSADSRLRSDGAITTNDWVMAYVLFKCFGSSSYVTNDVIYNLEDAHNMLTNYGVASAVESSLQVDEATGAGGYVDTMFTTLMAADPMRFFDASGRQPSGLFETNADISGVGSWNIVLNDVIEIPLQFTFAAPVTVNSARDTAGELSGNTDPTVIVKAGETFNIRLQLVAVASADASAAARLAAEAAALQADILATAQAVVAVAASAVAAAQTAYNLAAAAAAEAASKAAIANTVTAAGYAAHAAGRATVALAALNALIASQNGSSNNAAELATLADALAATAAAELAAAASNVAAAQAAYNTAAAAAAQAVIDSAAAGTEVATNALADAQAQAAAALASLLTLQLTAVTAANNAAAAAISAHGSHVAALVSEQEAMLGEASVLAATSMAQAQAAADEAAADAAAAATAAAAASASSDAAAAAAAEAAAIDAAQIAESASAAAAAAVCAAEAAAAAANAAIQASLAAAALVSLSRPLAATDLTIGGSSSVQCSWTNTPCFNPPTMITIQLYKAADNSQVASADLLPTVSNYTFNQLSTSLTTGISYYFKIITINSAGNAVSVGSPVSNALTVPIYDPNATPQYIGSATIAGNVDAIGADARFIAIVPSSIVIDHDSGALYVHDVVTTTNRKIKRLDLVTNAVTTFASIGSVNIACLSELDSSGNIYGASAKAIYRINSTSCTLIAGAESNPSNLSRDGIGSAALFYAVVTLRLHKPTNTLYLTDQEGPNFFFVRKVTMDGTVTTILGNRVGYNLAYQQNAPTVNGTGTGVTFYSTTPRLIGFVGGDIHLVFRRNPDLGRWWLAKFSMTTYEFTILTTSDTTMMPDTGYVNESFAPLPYYFKGPNTYFTDKYENLYLLVLNPSAVYKINVATNTIQTILTAPGYYRKVCAVGPDGKLYLTDSANLKKIDVLPSPV